jgi:hypothetical protein
MRGREPWNKAKALRELEAIGILRLKIAFSGGNDEGGVDDYTIDATVPNMAVPSLERVYPDLYDPTTRKYSERELSPAERATNELLDLLEGPIDDRYGSFAGDFHVSGVLHYDVPNRKVWIGGDEAQPREEPFSDEL